MVIRLQHQHYNFPTNMSLATLYITTFKQLVHIMSYDIVSIDIMIGCIIRCYYEDKEVIYYDKILYYLTLITQLKQHPQSDIEQMLMYKLLKDNVVGKRVALFLFFIRPSWISSNRIS